MATIKQCDRCGKIGIPVYFIRYQTARIIICNNEEAAFGERELCEDCRNELYAFMSGEQINRIEYLDSLKQDEKEA